MPNDEPQILAFPSATEWEAWLAQNAHVTQGLWLRIAKKGSGIATVTYDEALDAALGHGWIDGQRKTHDGEHFIQRFTPRRPRSLWSKRNVAKALALIESGRMRPAGHAEIEAAQSDGRWDAAYDSPKDMVIPADFLTAVEEHPEAKACLATLNRASRYAIAFRLHNARTPETRARRFAALLEMLARGEGPR